MRFPGIKMDLQDIRGQLGDLREHVNQLHFRKPWTTHRETSPLWYVAMGIVIAALAGFLFKYRHHCEDWCRGCLAPKKPRDSDDSGFEDTGTGEAAPI